MCFFPTIVMYLFIWNGPIVEHKKESSIFLLRRRLNLNASFIYTHKTLRVYKTPLSFLLMMVRVFSRKSQNSFFILMATENWTPTSHIYFSLCCCLFVLVIINKLRFISSKTLNLLFLACSMAPSHRYNLSFIIWLTVQVLFGSLNRIVCRLRSVTSALFHVRVLMTYSLVDLVDFVVNLIFYTVKIILADQGQ